MKLTKIILQVLIFSSLALPTLAQGKHHDRGMHKALNQLDLTDAQKKQLEGFRDENKGSMKELKQSMRSLKDELGEGFAANLPEEQLRPLHTKINGVKSQMGDAKFKKMMFLKSILTDDQRKEFLSLKKRRKKERSE